MTGKLRITCFLAAAHRSSVSVLGQDLFSFAHDLSSRLSLCASKSGRNGRLVSRLKSAASSAATTKSWACSRTLQRRRACSQRRRTASLLESCTWSDLSLQSERRLLATLEGMLHLFVLSVFAFASLHLVLPSRRSCTSEPLRLNGDLSNLSVDSFRSQAACRIWAEHMNAERRVRFALLGLGLIGQKHLQTILANKDIQLVALVEPSPAGATAAQRTGVPCFADVHELLASKLQIGAALIATPYANLR